MDADRRDAISEGQGGRTLSRAWLFGSVVVVLVGFLVLFALGSRSASNTGNDDTGHQAVEEAKQDSAFSTSSSAATMVMSSTTVPPATTTTTTLASTSVITFPLPSDWPPGGQPIAVADLTLDRSTIGPINIGMPIDEVAGALTASLGVGTASGVDGLCPPDETYWLQFGQLTVVFDGISDDAVLVSYRYDEPKGPNSDLGLETRLEIGIGDTVEDLINAYTDFAISFETIDSKDYFRITDGGDLLLWGPVSENALAGLIEGIYSAPAWDPSP